MKTTYTAAELMEVAIMCLQQLPETEPDGEKDAREYWCWHCDIRVHERDYAEHDRKGHDLQEEEPAQ